MSKIHPRQLVRDFLINNPDLADPGEIAEKLRANLGFEEREAIFDSMLRTFVRSVIHEARSQTSVRGGQGHRGTHLGPATSHGDNHSPKLERLRKYAHERELAGRYVGANDEWKLLAECSLEDVRAIIEGYEKRIAENAAQRERFKRLAETLEQSKAEQVSDLSTDAFMEAWEVAA